MSEITIAAFYKFVRIHDLDALKAALEVACERLQVKGTILLADEGINGTVAAAQENMEALLAFMRSDSRLDDLPAKFSYADEPPFLRMKVRLKNEIVTLGVPGTDPNERVGTYIEPKDWNALISDPDVVLVDTRNQYEVGIGTFKGAIDPQTTNFREFPDYVSDNLAGKHGRKIAMFCTGGIRCEKATAYMLNQGFDEVYHLKGGILKYLEEVPPEQSLWEGECFVFDERVAVNHQLERGSYDMCHGCRQPITDEDKLSPQYEKGVCCPHCVDKLTEDQKERFAERQKQVDLAKQRHEAHLGKRMIR